MHATLNTGLYRLRAPDAEYHVLHLYEHLVCQRLYRLIAEAGFNINLIGWISAEAHLGVITIDYGLYHPAVAQLVSDHLAKPQGRFHEDDLELELPLLESEDRILFTIPSRAQLLTKLYELDAHPFVNLATDLTPAELLDTYDEPPATTLVAARHAKSFRNVSIVVGLRDGTADEVALFARLAPILIDIVTYHLEPLGGYRKFYTTVRRNTYNATGVIAIFTLKRGAVTQRQLKADLLAKLHSFDAAAYADELDYYFDCFTNTSSWHNFPLEYFNDLHLVTSRPYIRTLATPDNITTLMRKLEVATRTTQSTDWESAC